MQIPLPVLKAANLSIVFRTCCSRLLVGICEKHSGRKPECAATLGKRLRFLVGVCLVVVVVLEVVGMMVAVVLFRCLGIYARIAWHNTCTCTVHTHTHTDTVTRE